MQDKDEREQLLHGYAKRLIKALNFTDVERDRENTQVLKEASYKNFSTNEVLVYAMTNEESIKKEIEKSGT